MMLDESGYWGLLLCLFIAVGVIASHYLGKWEQRKYRNILWSPNHAGILLITMIFLAIFAVPSTIGCAYTPVEVEGNVADISMDGGRIYLTLESGVTVVSRDNTLMTLQTGTWIHMDCREYLFGHGMADYQLREWSVI